MFAPCNLNILSARSRTGVSQCHLLRSVVHAPAAPSPTNAITPNRVTVSAPLRQRHTPRSRMSKLHVSAVASLDRMLRTHQADQLDPTQLRALMARPRIDTTSIQNTVSGAEFLQTKHISPLYFVVQHHQCTQTGRLDGNELIMLDRSLLDYSTFTPASNIPCTQQACQGRSEC